ncbi:carbon-nitrogen family hydrolase [Sporichthya brevicatena]|uniref:Carbon-nitrogen family hydrolase n=1 Tax=Sporichthya brevicatena TaxID=171442 RepID=A0ABN1GUP4_9ACTN
MRVCLVQLEVNLAQPLAERVAQACETVRSCAGADLVVLPELWPQGAWAYREWEQTAEPLDGPTVAALAQAAKDAGVMLHGGSVVERAGDDLFNTSVLLGPHGDLRAIYRKIHRFGFAEGEAAVMTAGDEFLTVTGGELTMGVATCYDLRFPELFRRLTEAGAQMFVIASSWPERRLEHWRLLTRARAVENLAYVVAADACGEHHGVRQAGHSVVIDPWGEVVAEAGTEPTVIDVEIDPARVEQVRADFPALRDRRL